LSVESCSSYRHGLHIVADDVVCDHDNADCMAGSRVPATLMAYRVRCPRRREDEDQRVQRDDSIEPPHVERAEIVRRQTIVDQDPDDEKPGENEKQIDARP
jgi:hypothetical protein